MYTVYKKQVGVDCVEAVKVKSRAKINLTLDVLYRREDGFHELEMVMQSLKLYDSIAVQKTAQAGVFLQTDVPFLPTDERNLAYRAARKMQEAFALPGGVQICLTKRIPVAAGLAGGSGNAAAVLAAMNELYELNLSLQELMKLGLTLGSDVPYCLFGKTALAKGRGEILEELPDCPHFYVVLAKPDFGVSTGAVFRALQAEKIGRHPDTAGMLRAIEAKDRAGICARLENVLEPVTFQMQPQVQKIKDFLAAQGAEGVLMSGSGPTIFALFTQKEAAEEACQKTKEAFAMRTVLVTETVDKGEQGYGLSL